MCNKLRWLAVIALAAIAATPPNEEPAVVPDGETAIKLAEVILFKRYGEDNIKSQRPYDVVFKDGIWRIEGTLPLDAVGGTFRIEINQKDACVLRLRHWE